MNYSFFLMPLLSSFIIATILLVALIVLTQKFKNIDGRITARHIHAIGISRYGGVAIILSFIATLLLDNRLVIGRPLAGVLICCGAILMFGIIDDLKNLGWKSQLFFQIVIVLIVFAMGVKLQYISSPLGGIFFFDSGLAYFLGILISIVWVIFLMNAMNWVDGIDGISGGITLVACLAIFIISQRPEVNQPPIGIITAAIIGSLAAFLLLNFHPAKIMAGTSGSMFMGFILAILAIFAGAKIATTLMVLAVPIIDALWVMVERIKSKESIFLADQRHLHYRLLELGWSVKKICVSYWVITLFIAILALNIRAAGKMATLAILCVSLIFVMAAIASKVSRMKKIHA